MGILGEFFSPEAGQRRRQWLNRQDRAVYDLMQTYLGPTGIPDRLSVLGKALEYTDAGDMVEAADASRAVWNDPSLANVGRYATAAAAMSLPFVGGRIANEFGDAVASGADDLTRFMADQSGSVGADPVAARGDEILSLVKTNPRAVTDDMLDLGDPVLNTRLNEYLFRNYDLPMDEASRMARAGEMGFHEANVYHATPFSFDGFDLSKSGVNTTIGDQERAVFLSDRPDGASSFISRGYVADFRPFDGLNTLDDARARYLEIDKAQGERAAKDWWSSEVVPRSPTYLDYADGGNVIPARIGTNRGFSAWDYYGRGYDSDQAVESILDAKSEGSDAVVWRDIVDGGFMGGHKKQNVVAHFDPTQIRSRFARFDPRLSHLRNLSAGILPFLMAGGALSQMQQGEQQ